MNSPQLPKILILSALLAAISFALTATVIPLTSFSVAIIVFIASFVIANSLSISSESITDSNSDRNSESNDDTNVDLKTLYVGNLPYRANEMAIRELFSAHGTVHSVRLMKDKHTGKRRGFGFVEISAADADTAISALNDEEFQQRTLKVREAKERPEKTPVDA